MKRRSLSTYVYALSFVAITIVVAVAARSILEHTHSSAAAPRPVLTPDQWMAADFDADGKTDWITFDPVASNTTVRAYRGTASSPSWKRIIPGRFSGPAHRVIRRGDRLLVPVALPGPAIDAVRISDGKLIYSRELAGGRWSRAPLLSAPTALVAVTGGHGHVRATVIEPDSGTIRWQRSFEADLDGVRAPVRWVAGTVMVPMNGWVELLRSDRKHLRPVTRGFELTGPGPQLLARSHSAGEPATLLRWNAKELRFDPEQPGPIDLGRDLIATAVYRDRVVSLLGGNAVRLRVQPLGGGAVREATLPAGSQIAGTPLLSPLAGWRRGDCVGARYLPVVLERPTPAKHGRVRIAILDTESATLTWSSRSLRIPYPVRFADAAFCMSGNYYWKIPSDTAKGGGLVVIGAARGKVEWLSIHTRSGAMLRAFAALDPAHIRGNTLLGVSLLGRFTIDLAARKIVFDESNQLELTVTTP